MGSRISDLDLRRQEALIIGSTERVEVDRDAVGLNQLIFGWMAEAVVTIHCKLTMDVPSGLEVNNAVMPVGVVRDNVVQH